jgi:formylglycine-generating enzyme required for sulfatase activity
MNAGNRISLLLIAVMGLAWQTHPAASAAGTADFEGAMAAVAASAPDSPGEQQAMRAVIAIVRKAPKPTPADAATHAARARAMAQTSRPEDLLNAAGEAALAVRLAPWVGEYQFLHGQLLAKTGANAAAEEAFSLYLDAVPMAPDRADVQKLIAGLQRSPALVPLPKTSTGGPQHRPGEIFRDCPKCPEMVTVPAGHFVMGSPAGEQGRFDAEGPQHEVFLRSFALGKYPVTEEQFAAFLAETGYQPAPCDRILDKSWRSPGRGIVFPPGLADLPQQPAVCVNWNDARAFADWVNRKVPGGGYRLPSEAEWEYAARAGTETARWWGEDVGSGKANCHGCGSVWDNSLIAPVGSFGPNPFGLYDMLGNVWQWTADCWNENYAKAPVDGSAWTAGDCTKRVMRGGSWSNIPVFVRSAARSRGDAAGGDFDYSSYAGFRLAKSLLN